MSARLQYWLIKMLSRIICLLPYPLVCRLGRGLGKILYWVISRQRDRGIAQLMQGLKISHQEADQIIRRLFANIGQTFMEILYTPALTPAKIDEFITINGTEHLAQAFGQGRGVVLLTGHFGNWEWLGAALARVGFPTTTIVKPQPNPVYTRLLNEYRELVGLTVFNRGTSEILQAARALKQGKILGFLADEDGGTDGIFVDFFGKMASCPAGPATFARKFGSVIVPASISRRAGGGHTVVIEPPLVYSHHQNAKQEIYENTVTVTKWIESTIRKQPDEWLWFRKRWNTPYCPEEHLPAKD